MCKLKIWPKPSQDWNTQPHVESWILQKTSPYADLFGENHRATSNRTRPRQQQQWLPHESDREHDRDVTGLGSNFPAASDYLPTVAFNGPPWMKIWDEKVPTPRKTLRQKIRQVSPRSPSLGGGSNVLVPSSFNRTKASAVVRPSGTLKVPPEGPGWVVNKAVFSEAMKLQSLKGTGICRTWEHAEKMM